MCTLWKATGGGIGTYYSLFFGNFQKMERRLNFGNKMEINGIYSYAYTKKGDRIGIISGKGFISTLPKSLNNDTLNFICKLKVLGVAFEKPFLKYCIFGINFSQISAEYFIGMFKKEKINWSEACEGENFRAIQVDGKYTSFSAYTGFEFGVIRRFKLFIGGGINFLIIPKGSFWIHGNRYLLVDSPQTFIHSFYLIINPKFDVKGYYRKIFLKEKKGRKK